MTRNPYHREAAAWATLSPEAQFRHVMALTEQRNRAEALQVVATARLAQQQDTIAELHTTIADLRASNAGLRESLITMMRAATQRTCAELSTPTPGVMRAENWPVKGRGETP